MPKWEYLTFTAAYATGDGLGMVKTVNGVERKEWKKESWPVADALQQLGGQGWELVTVLWRNSETSITDIDPVYYFKRPKD